MALYPAVIPTNTDYPNRTDDVDWIYAARYNEIKNELIAICVELGVNPKGAAATVVARLALLALKASPTFTGIVTAPTINLTGGQIAFPATAVPSADPNTIDDYEEGTWTPEVAFGGASVDITYSLRSGTYTKIGDRVHVDFSMRLASKGSSSGVAGVITYPFATSLNDLPSAFVFRNISFANIVSTILATTTLSIFQVTEAGVLTNITNTNFSDTARLAGFMVYKI